MPKWPTGAALILSIEPVSGDLLIRDYRSWELVERKTQDQLAHGEYELEALYSWLKNPPPDTGPNPADPEYARSLRAKPDSEVKSRPQIDIDDLLGSL